ncbi:MAG: pyruvate ferredoxin oxidoreductase [Clostridia bacterium BRH_c25]|nr:MAG: pyruvate ferredoxin oxidoreductase [Clostridia bacterium BRH_c25]
MKFKSNYIVPIGADGIHILNTGDWRTQRPVLNEEKCTRCGICFMYCPVNSIEKHDKKFIISYDYCKGCGICSHECPSKAIDMIPEEGK